MSAEGFNTARPMIMHIDLNSCFATIEQQSRPLLRGKPVAVVNRRTERTSIVTASYEAKARGVKVGMRVSNARFLCPDLIAIESDPPKYRYVCRRLKAILEDYSPKVRMKSVDEGLIDFSESPISIQQRDLMDVGREIKQRLREEIGEYMMCNVGIGVNRFLAKTAASLNKPDGLNMITHLNLRQIYENLELEDLNGIAGGYGRRLRQVGITTPLEFLDAEESILVSQVFRSKCGSDWYKRLRGWEVDDLDFELKTISRQYVLDDREMGYDEILRRFHNLTEDLASKLRAQQVRAHGVRIYVKTYHAGRWHNLYRQNRAIDDESGLFEIVRGLLYTAPLPAYEIGVTCYGLASADSSQPDLFGEGARVDKLTSAIDDINQFWGPRTVHSADTLGLDQFMKRKIPFSSTRLIV